MEIIGFNFTKINAERFIIDKKTKINIKTNIDIKDIKKIKLERLNKKQDFTQIDFQFILDYEPSFAKLEFKGNIILSLELKESKEILGQWKKKKISPEFQIPIFNFILKKVSVKSLEIEELLNIPPHFPLPTLKQ